MACGTPVLATDVGGIPDVIEDGINGFLIENNKPEKISMVIRKLIARDDLAEISINAERFINNHYSIEPVQKKWEDLSKFL
jgi:glycosyltransferase involved in cell wall biosynthesis